MSQPTVPRRWSWSTGERGKNRVRVFEHWKSGLLFLQFSETVRGGSPRVRCVGLGHADRERAKAQAEQIAGGYASPSRRWAWSTGQRGRNRVRVFEHWKSGQLFAQFSEVALDGRRRVQCVALGHADRERAKAYAEELAARFLTPRREIPNFRINARGITPVQRARILERDDFTCRRCGSKPADGIRLVVDHVVPVALGGSKDAHNLQTLCEPCNQGKAARRPHQKELAGATSQ